MKTIKRIILLFLLLILFSGIVLLDPLVRFSIDLNAKRFDAAQIVYLSHISDSPTRRKEAEDRLRAYVTGQMERYYGNDLSYDAIHDILFSLSDTRLPQEDITRCLASVNEMQTARIDLAQADELYAIGDLAGAIPLFRRSMIADASVPYRLSQAESMYRDRIIQQAEAAMDAGRFAEAESLLVNGLDILGGNEDLCAALSDVRRMEADRAYVVLTEETHRLMTDDGAAAAFRYIADLRSREPEKYELMYVEQLLFHAFEEQTCAQAVSLFDDNDPYGACSLLEDALQLLDSEKIRALHDELLARSPILLKDIPVLSDETANTKNGAKSTIQWDRFLTDVRSNEYQHSFSAQRGTVTFSLNGSFAIFSGTVSFPMGERSDVYRASASLQVFGDGKLIAEFKEFDDASSPIPFRIPVAGIRTLSLSWTCEGANGWKDWGQFATVFDAVLMATDE